MKKTLMVQVRRALEKRSATKKLLTLLTLAFLSLTAPTHALTFELKQDPTQCEELTIEFHGDYTPPVSYLFIPSNPEAENVPDLIADYERDYEAKSTTIPAFNFPEGTEFTLTLSDASNFGSGGTSSIMKVGEGTSNSCLMRQIPAGRSTLIHRMQQ